MTLLRWLHALRKKLRTPTAKAVRAVFGPFIWLHKVYWRIRHAVIVREIERHRKHMRRSLRIPYQRPSQFLDSTKRNTPGACP